jgi:hypothetical protein
VFLRSRFRRGDSGFFMMYPTELVLVFVFIYLYRPGLNVCDMSLDVDEIEVDTLEPLQS